MRVCIFNSIVMIIELVPMDGTSVSCTSVTHKWQSADATVFDV